MKVELDMPSLSKLDADWARYIARVEGMLADERAAVERLRDAVVAQGWEIEALKAATNRYLDNDGSRGRFDALALADAREELNDALSGSDS